MPGRLELDRKGKLTAPDARQQFLTCLNGTLRPTMLLRLEAVHVHRQLRRCYDVGKINEFPAGKLSAITQIEVFAQRIVLPASTLLYARAPPQPGRSVKIEKPAATAARGLFKQKMSIQKDCLHPRE